MSSSATLYHLQVALSDVDRSVYETLDFRIALHPSESMRRLFLRAIAYCLSFEEGIAFSKGGLSSSDEPALAVRDLTGVLIGWIDVGAPAAERLHKASKAAKWVAVYTDVDPARLQREAATTTIHKIQDIRVWHIESHFLDSAIPHLDRHSKFELVRNEGQLYLTLAGQSLSGAITEHSLVA